MSYLLKMGSKSRRVQQPVKEIPMEGQLQLYKPAGNTEVYEEGQLAWE